MQDNLTYPGPNAPIHRRYRNPLDPDGLRALGIIFPTLSMAQAFADVVREELEERIGRAISELLTGEQLWHFRHLPDPQAATEWLKENCPSYPEIVDYQSHRMKNELLRCRSQIRGALRCAEADRNARRIDMPELSLRSFNCLRRARIDTIGELLALDDLTWVRNLSPACLSEIGELRARLRAEEQNATNHLRLLCNNTSPKTDLGKPSRSK